MVSARQALFTVVFIHLNNASTLWADRLEPLSVASARLPKPYVVFFEAAGGREPRAARRFSYHCVLSVKGVALTLAEGEAISAALSEKLHDSGDQDIDPRLPYHADWRVLTVTEDRSIYIEEKFAEAQSIYHCGHQYQVMMEAR